MTKAMPGVPYITQQGDMVDAIALSAYGTKIGTAELVYAANRGLAGLGAVLEEGITIQLPVVSPKPSPVRATVNLWD